MKKLSIRIGIVGIATLVVLMGIAYFFYNTTQKTKADQALAVISFDKKTGDFVQNQDQTVNVIIRPQNAGNTLSGANLIFSTTNIAISDIGTIGGVTSGGTAIDASKISVVVNTAIDSGRRVSVVVKDTTENLPIQLQIPVTFHGLAPGGASLQIKTDQSQIVGPVTGNEYGFGTVDQGSYNISSSSGGGGGGSASSTVTLHLKLRFQGINAKPQDAYNSMKVKVGLGSPALNTPLYQTMTATSDAAGVWSGDVTFQTAPGNYYVLIKGPKHLQKKVCDLTPTETIIGGYHCQAKTIALTADMTLNFTGISQLAGDLPLNGQPQNGVIDADDAAYIRQNLSKTTAAALAIGDLNLDGIIDSQDYSMILNTLSIRNDEE